MKMLLSILTILASGVMSAFVTFRLNAALQERNFLLSKAEALFVGFHEYTTSLSTHYLPYMRVMNQELTYDQALDITLKDGPVAEGHYRTVTMLVGIYFPRLAPALAELLTCRDRLSAIRADFKRQYQQGALDGRPFLKPMRESLGTLDQIEGRMKDLIFQEAKAIRGASLWLWRFPTSPRGDNAT